MATAQQIQAAMRGFPRNLAWNNFKPVQNSPKPPSEAETAAGWSFGHGGIVLVNGEYRPRNVAVTVTLNPASWATPSARGSTALLTHEQGHYDITGLVARDVVQQMLDWSYADIVIECAKDSGKSPADYLRYANKLFTADVKKFVDDANALMARLQTNPVTKADGIYDVQTNHSQNTGAQSTWDNRFTRLKSQPECFSLWLKMEGVI